MIRATTGGVLRSYRFNLMNSYINQGNAMNTILTQRNFNSYAEDPASAAKAFRLRKSRMTTQSQYNICTDTWHKYQSAFSSLESVSLMVDNDTGTASNTLKGMTLEMLNDPTGDAREQLTKALDQVSEAIIQCMNQKYGDNFIFAGADGHNVPFEVKELEDGTKQLFYRGVSVDAAEPALMKDGTGADIQASNGEYVLAKAALIEQNQLPKLEEDADGDPITIVGTEGGSEGKYYYLLDGADPAIDADTFATMVEDGTANAEDYVQVSVFTPLLGANTTEYYRKDQIIEKDEYDKISDSILRDENGDPITVEKDGQDYYIEKANTDATISQEDYDTACKDAEKLAYLVDEKLYVDIGLGFQEKDGSLIPSSAFNASLIGINFIGYGVDEDGDPKNLYSLVQKMKELADSVPDGGDWSKSTWDEFDRLVGKFETASSEFHTAFVNQDASTDKLETNADLLKENYYNLQEQYAELEDIEPVEAINNFLWAQYAYNAALKVGNSVLSQSLMDYLS